MSIGKNSEFSGCGKQSELTMELELVTGLVRGLELVMMEMASGVGSGQADKDEFSLMGAWCDGGKFPRYSPSELHLDMPHEALGDLPTPACLNP